MTLNRSIELFPYQVCSQLLWIQCCSLGYSLHRLYVLKVKKILKEGITTQKLGVELNL